MSLVALIAALSDRYSCINRNTFPTTPMPMMIKNTAAMAFTGLRGSHCATARAIKHVRDLVGNEYVALGSDFDGATTVRFDTGQLVQVTQALLDEGFTPDEIRAVMGGNAGRVIAAGIVPQGPRAP